jgi:hypothetical protein
MGCRFQVWVYECGCEQRTQPGLEEIFLHYPVSEKGQLVATVSLRSKMNRNNSLVPKLFGGTILQIASSWDLLALCSYPLSGPPKPYSK